jgi:MFS transporter, PAT family, beta-lactamase induction signal transducer AmpG
VRMGPLFLLDRRGLGGLGLATDQVGTIYGTFGSIAFLSGSFLGGYFASWLGLRRALLPLVCAMNLPNLAYVYLSAALPASSFVIGAALSAEMFGYGFGYVGVMLLMMQEIAPGRYQTAHYAFANSLMNLGLMVPGAVSGKIEMALGYRNFFIWVLVCSIPAMVLSRFLPIGRGTPAPAIQAPAETGVVSLT